MLPVSVDQLNVLLILASIAINPSILAIKYHAAIRKVLSKIQLRVGAVQQIVLLNLIVTNLHCNLLRMLLVVLQVLAILVVQPV